MQFFLKKLIKLAQNPARVQSIPKVSSFYEFCDLYRDQIGRMRRDGVFTLSGGSAEIHKNDAGQISKIKLVQWK